MVYIISLTTIKRFKITLQPKLLILFLLHERNVISNPVGQVVILIWGKLSYLQDFAYNNFLASKCT